MAIIALFMIVGGVAVDNLFMAGWGGNGVSILNQINYPLKKDIYLKLIFILMLLLFIQNQVLIYGNWFAEVSINNHNHAHAFFAVLIFFSIGLSMFQELNFMQSNLLRQRIKSYNIIGLTAKESVYIFTASFAAHWFHINDNTTKLYFIPVMAFCLIIGFLLRKYFRERAFHVLPLIASTLILAGFLIILFDK